VVEIGRYIIIRGPTGSGKSTLAGQISQRVGIPHIELDAIFWKPGWVESPLEEFRADVSAALGRCPDGWVIDGNYSRVRDLTLPMAETVVWLRPPFRVAFWRLLNRTIARCLDGKIICGTNRETWRQAFFSRDSLLLYQITHWRYHFKHTIEGLEKTPHHAEVIELRSQKEVDAFLRGLV
jgi:adenylate kinase family enzyme